MSKLKDEARHMAATEYPAAVRKLMRSRRTSTWPKGKQRMSAIGLMSKDKCVFCGKAECDCPYTGKEDQLTFAEWKERYAPNDSGEDYDLRAAFFAGVVPDEHGHWPDLFKKPNHPTFSKESVYAIGKAAKRAGTWEGDKFIPAKPEAGACWRGEGKMRRRLPDRMYTVIDGVFPIYWECMCIYRNAGPTFVCAGCNQGVAGREGDIRKRCRVCKRKLVAQLPEQRPKGQPHEPAD